MQWRVAPAPRPGPPANVGGGALAAEDQLRMLAGGQGSPVETTQSSGWLGKQRNRKTITPGPREYPAKRLPGIEPCVVIILMRAQNCNADAAAAGSAVPRADGCRQCFAHAATGAVK